MDHLDGVLILDRISRAQRKEAMRAMREAREQEGAPAREGASERDSAPQQERVGERERAPVQERASAVLGWAPSAALRPRLERRLLGTSEFAAAVLERLAAQRASPRAGRHAS